MRTRIAALTIAALAAVTGVIAPAAPVHAVSGLVECRIQPYNPTFSSPCFTSYAAYTYTVNFQVTGATPGSTFAWSLQGAVGSTYGCAATDQFCTKYVIAVQGDRTLSASVTVTYGGQSSNLYTEAYIPAVCGPYLC